MIIWPPPVSRNLRICHPKTFIPNPPFITFYRVGCFELNLTCYWDYYSLLNVKNNSLTSIWGICGSKMRNFSIAHFESLITPNTLPNNNTKTCWPCLVMNTGTSNTLRLFSALLMFMGQNESRLEQGNILLKIDPILLQGVWIALETCHMS